MAPSLRDEYERRAEKYPDRDPTAEMRSKKAVELAAMGNDHRVLDLGCKDGVLLQTLRKQNFEGEYTGVDIAERVLARGRARRLEGLFVRADIGRSLPLTSQSFDRVFALELLEHLVNPANLLREAERLLAPQGRLLLSVPNPYYYMELINELRGFPDTEGHLYSFTNANLTALLERHGFTIEASLGTYLLIPKKLRGPFRDQAFWLVSKIPRFLACSRIYRCHRTKSRFL